jgi:hypothetical protein
MTLDEAVHKERHRRARLRREGRPLHYWEERGDAEPPLAEYWCGWCQGWYGVPHVHEDHWCKNVGRAMRGERQCACVVCVVAEQQTRVS